MKKSSRVLLLAALGVILAAAAPGANAAALEQIPHRAAYELSLGQAKHGSAVRTVTGVMLYEWADACDGWTTQQRFSLSVGSDAGSVEIGSNYVTWEAKDGLGFRFHMRHLEGPAKDNDLAGRVTFPAEGKAGRAVFDKPEGLVQELPADTMLPSEHTLALIEAARAGAQTFSRMLFDGTSRTGPQEVNAVIVDALPPDGDPPVPELRDVRSWQMRLAFFPLASREAGAEYELGVRYYENGVADDVVMDFGDFTVEADLAELEVLPAPVC